MILEWYKSSIEVKNEQILTNVDDFYKSKWYTWQEEAYNIYNSTLYENNRNNPFLLKDSDIFVWRMLEAEKNDEKILIFWDFDMDWISSTAIMMKGLKYLGYNNLYYKIPNRRIGYSIKREYIDEFIEENWFVPDLIITVDCWIRSIEDIDSIQNDLWIDILVTDHHLPFEWGRIPNSLAVINPHRQDCQYPFPSISGSFVALKAIELLMDYRYENWNYPFVDWPKWNYNFAFKELQELSTLWTISDVMPIMDENALLVKSNLWNFHRSQNLGIAYMAKQYLKWKWKKYAMDTSLVWFWIWPLINAAWRIWDPKIGLKLLLSDNIIEVEQLYVRLYQINEERKKISKDWTNKAIESIEKINNDNKWIVYIDEELNEWIIWLVAWRIKEAFFKPTIVIGSRIETENWDIIYKWSWRSVEWVNIYEIVNQLWELLEWYWWHAWACGLWIKEENLEDFINGFINICNNTINENLVLSKKIADWLIEPYTLTENFIDGLEYSWPYWHMNPSPTFLLVWTIQSISFPESWSNPDNYHVYINMENGIRALKYNVNQEEDFAEYLSKLEPWENVAIYWVPEINEYKWNKSIQYRLEDVAKIL